MSQVRVLTSIIYYIITKCLFVKKSKIKYNIILGMSMKAQGLGWPVSRGGKIGSTRWASPIHPELGPGWAIKLLARKKLGQIWPGPIWPDPTYQKFFFFTFKKLFGPTSPVFRAGWAAKILAKRTDQFWPCPILAQPTIGPARPA